VSGRPRGAAIVSREYQPAPECCVRAVELLLKPPVSKGDRYPERDPDDTREESENGSRAYQSIPE
jgi:hypothetical protein